MELLEIYHAMKSLTQRIGGKRILNTDGIYDNEEEDGSSYDIGFTIVSILKMIYFLKYNRRDCKHYDKYKMYFEELTTLFKDNVPSAWDMLLSNGDDTIAENKFYDILGTLSCVETVIVEDCVKLFDDMKDIVVLCEAQREEDIVSQTFEHICEQEKAAEICAWLRECFKNMDHDMVAVVVKKPPELTAYEEYSDFYILSEQQQAVMQQACESFDEGELFYRYYRCPIDFIEGYTIYIMGETDYDSADISCINIEEWMVLQEARALIKKNAKKTA